MNGDRRDARRIRPVEDLEKLLAALGRVVDAAAHLHRDRNVRRHGVAHAADDLERHRRLAQMKSAPAAAQHFLHRAAEVDVDHVEAALDQPQCGRRELLRVGPHQLPAGRMLFVGDVQKVPIPPPRLQVDDELVEHHFAERVRRPSRRAISRIGMSL